MVRIITFSAVLVTSAIVFLTSDAKAQQADFRRTQGAAMTTAAGPEFCQRGPCHGLADVAKLSRSTSPIAPKPKTSGPFPPQPYQHSRSQLQAAAPAEQQRPGGDPWAQAFEDAHSTTPRTKFDPNTDDELEYRSRRIFSDFQNEPARQQWIAVQKQQAIANEINRTKPLIYPVTGR
jgi:hypothetical protein